MLDQLLGLPAHPLLVHLPVVLLPLVALGVVALAARPAWRPRYAGLVLVGAVVGALGVLSATIASIDELGHLAPVLIAAVGIGLIVVGLRWSRWRESIRLAFLARIPARARDLVERLAP